MLAPASGKAGCHAQRKVDLAPPLRVKLTVYSAREYSDNFAERSKKVGKAGDSGEGRGSLHVSFPDEKTMDSSQLQMLRGNIPVRRKTFISCCDCVNLVNAQARNPWPICNKVNYYRVRKRAQWMASLAGPGWARRGNCHTLL